MWMKWLSFLVALCVGIQGWPAEPQGGMALERGTESIGPTPPATHLVNITMPSIRPDKEDQYLCYGKKITEEEVYIVNFKALATASRTHHLLVYGCQQPQMLSDNAWPCHSICGPSETPRILYAWAKNADPTHMPDNVGFELGGETRLNYVVIQVHYKTPLEVGEPPDQSGVQLTLTSQRQQYIAGIFIFMRYQLQIPPHTKGNNILAAYFCLSLWTDGLKYRPTRKDEELNMGRRHRRDKKPPPNRKTVWATLRYVPKGVLWPALLETTNVGDPYVYLKSENALLKAKHVIPFTASASSDNYEQSKRILEKKKRVKTLQLFEIDFSWVKSEVDSTPVDQNSSRDGQDSTHEGQDATTAEGQDSTPEGQEFTPEGQDSTTPEDQDSATEGQDSTPKGQDFTPQGQDSTTPEDQDSTAEGQDSTPKGQDSTSPEDQDSTAEGQDSTHKGQDSTPDGKDSTLEGQDFTPEGQDSTLEGQDSTPEGQDSTTPDDQDSTAEGQDSTPKGQDSNPAGQESRSCTDGKSILMVHIESVNGQQEQLDSTPEVQDSKTPEDQDSTAEGQHSTPDGQDSTLEGQDSMTPEDQDSTAEGQDSTPKGQDSTSPEDQDSTAEGQDSTHKGQDSTPDGKDSTLEGQDFTPEGQDSTLEGQDSTPEGQDSTTPDDQDSTAEGQDSTPKGQDSNPAGQESRSCTDGKSILMVHIESVNGQQEQLDSTPVDHNSTCDGQNSTPEGQNSTLKGQDSTPEGGQDSTSPEDQDSTAEGQDSIPDGQDSTPKSQDSIPDGQDSTPKSQDSTAEGQDSIPDGQDSTPKSQDSTAEGQDSIPDGQDSTPKSQDSIPDGQDSTPKSQDSTAEGQDSIPDGQDSTPKSQDSTAEGQDSIPDGQDSTPKSQDSTAEGQDSIPDGQDSTPKSQDSIPDGQDSTPKSQDSTAEGQDSTPEGQDSTSPEDQDSTPNGQDSIPDGKESSQCTDEKSIAAAHNESINEQLQQQMDFTTQDGLDSTTDSQDSTTDSQDSSPDGQCSTPDGQRSTPDGQRSTPDGQRSTPDGQSSTLGVQVLAPDGQIFAPGEIMRVDYVGQGNPSNGDESSPEVSIKTRNHVKRQQVEHNGSPHQGPHLKQKSTTGVKVFTRVGVASKRHMEPPAEEETPHKKCRRSNFIKLNDNIDWSHDSDNDMDYTPPKPSEMDTSGSSDSDDETSRKKRTKTQKKSRKKKNDVPVEPDVSDLSEDRACGASNSQLPSMCASQVHDEKDETESSDEGASDTDCSADEVSINRCVDMPGLYFRKLTYSETTITGKKKKHLRVYNSYQYCAFCKTKVSNFAQHVRIQHKKKDEVEKIINSDLDSKKQGQLLTLLRLQHNHMYNMQSRRKERGELFIERRTAVVHGDMSCKYNGQTSLYPFAFRVHAHTLGRVITAYHFNNTWNLIGKGNPQWPQAFYPVVGKHEIKPGETMFGRCTYDSSERGRSTKIGGKHTDEMCNFYMMYYTDASRGDSYIQCINNQIQPLPAPIPADSDTPLPPNPELEDIAQGVHHYPGVQLVKDWPALGDRELGQVSAVATDSSGNVHIFHRGKRVWGQESFDQYNHFREPAVAIQEKTLITFNEDGQVIHEWGENIFYMPHGLHIDQQGNHWVTDVGLHQVFKFKPGSTKPLLTLGKRFEPGSDAQHFCKPTDVAVLSTGEFFVADGYCNHRVMKFAANGQYLMEWGTRTSSVTEGSYPPPSAFDIPHSITALEDQKQVCVADRENGRIQCFHYNGTFTRQIHPHEFHHRLFAVNYNPTHKLMFAVNGPDVYDQTTPVQGFVLDGQTDTLLEHFGANSLRFSNPHDVAADDVGSALYVAEIGPNKIWKFKISPEIIKGHSRPSSVDTETGSGDMGLSTMMSGDFQVSVVIGLLLVIPILIIVAITVVMRLKKNGKLKFLNRTKYNNRRFNLGDFFGSHKGFDRLATEDGDELEHLNSDSDVEEYSATTRKA